MSSFAHVYFCIYAICMRLVRIRTDMHRCPMRPQLVCACYMHRGQMRTEPVCAFFFWVYAILSVAGTEPRRYVHMPVRSGSMMC